jgi:beta-lactamase class A
VIAGYDQGLVARLQRACRAGRKLGGEPAAERAVRTKRNNLRGGDMRTRYVPAALVSVLTAQVALAQPPRPSPTPAPLEKLRSSVERITRSLNATWGIYVKCLETGEELALDADRQMDTMSTIKIPLMIEAFEQIKAGRFKLEDRYTLAKADMLPGTGILQRLDAGAVMSVKDLITLMIIVSDNSATDVVFRMVGGPEAVNRRMESLGLKLTRATTSAREWFAALQAESNREKFHREAKHPYGLSSAREMGLLLERMEQGKLVDEPSSKLMLEILRRQLYRTRIPRFLSGWSVPHKTGDFLPFIADDVGVLEARGRTVVISVFTANHFGSGEALEEAIGRVAEQVAAYFAYR